MEADKELSKKKSAEFNENNENEEAEQSPVKQKKKRSPSKEKLAKKDGKKAEKANNDSETVEKKKRGRPKKQKEGEEEKTTKQKSENKSKADKKDKKEKKEKTEKTEKPKRRKSSENLKKDSKSGTETSEEEGKKVTKRKRKTSKSSSMESIKDKSSSESVSSSTSNSNLKGKRKRSKKQSGSTTEDESVSTDAEEKFVRRSTRYHNNANEGNDDMLFGEISDSELYESDTETEETTETNESLVHIQKLFAYKKEDDKMLYYVKYTGMSYRQCEWIDEEAMNATKNGAKMIKKFMKNNPTESPMPPYFDPLYEVPEKVITVKKDEETNEDLYLVKWRKLEYEENTWETAESLDAPDLIDKFEKDNKLPSMEQRFIPPHPSPDEWEPIKSVPRSKSGYKIRPYQLEGVNFLANSWFNKRNAILADEMGLGKTLQSTSLLYYLVRVHKVWGPFLVICPLTIIEQWEREINEWTNMKVVAYCGPREKRKCTKQYELFYPNTQTPKFQVLLTTYEYVTKEESVFSKINWQALVIDEAHRLKNHQSKVFSALRSYNTEFKILLTGTPLQNNTEELWSLLNFLDDKKFNDLTSYKEMFGNLNDTDQIVELKKILKPLMLRRLKGDVEKNIKPLEEIIIECAMTQHQKGYYQSIYHHNLEYLTRGAHKANGANLNNISMELRKVCNHPYLLQNAEEQILIERRALAKIPPNEPDPPFFAEEALIRSSGKMILLDKLLEKLKKDGHRVLIFSQMTRMLDILQDYLYYKDYTYERLDGSIRGDLRQASIDNFNKVDSDVFVFLLCTKAGGLGINLTSADTVIIYDSDWNPQNDLQATARCHRIGQKKDVKVYRFITSKSYERTMFDRASLKLGLDHAVLESNKGQNNEDIEKLLRLGAYYAFKEEDKEQETETFGEEDIDSIISRSQTIKHENLGAGDGSTFSKASFQVDDEVEGVDLSAPDFWQKYLPVVVEDDIYDGLSIAERYRFKRETDTNNIDLSMSDEALENADKKSMGDFFWSKNKMKTLMVNLWCFGWGRWRIIYEKCKFNCEISEIKSVAHVIIKWLCEANPNQSPILDAIYKQGISHDTEKFENKFSKKYKEDFEPDVVRNSPWKIGRLELLHFLNSAVQACENPPEGLVVGNVIGGRPAEWWSEADDKILLYGIYLNGFGNHESIKFTHDNPNSKLLTTRLKYIIANLKNTYIRYKEENNVEIPFNYQTLSMLRDKLTKKDHKAILYTLLNFGFTNHDEFREISGLTHKSANVIDEYVDKVMDYMQKADDAYIIMRRERKAENEESKNQSTDMSRSISIDRHVETNPSQESNGPSQAVQETPVPSQEQQSQTASSTQEAAGSQTTAQTAEKSSESLMPDGSFLIEKINMTTVSRTINRMKLFDDVREECDSPKVNGQNKDFVNYIAEHGFLDYSSSPLINDIFGNDPTEKKITKKLKDIIKYGTERKMFTREKAGHDENDDKSTTSEKVHIIPYYEKDEEGNPIFPLNLSSTCRLISLGRVVYDKPAFHSQRYLYNDGYISEKRYVSVVDPTEKCWYRNTIEDNGGDLPVFKVTVVDHPEIPPFEGNSPSNPWMAIIKEIEDKAHNNRKMTISGPEYFCLSQTLTLYLMSKMENADKCFRFMKDKFTEEGSAEAAARPEKPTTHVRTRRADKRTRKVKMMFSDDDDDDEPELQEDEETSRPAGKKRGSRPKPHLVFNFKYLLESRHNPTPSSSFSLPWLQNGNKASFASFLDEYNSPEVAQRKRENSVFRFPEPVQEETQPTQDQQQMMQPTQDQQQMMQPTQDQQQMMQPTQEQQQMMQPTQEQQQMMQPTQDQTQMMQPEQDQTQMMQPTQEQQQMMQPEQEQMQESVQMNVEQQN